MPELDEATVNSYAPNSEAMSNGRKLVLKGAFVKLCKSEEDDLLFGECQGSGKTPYKCSSDFIQPEKPVHRCSCPSRQFPCKHCLGLMYAFVQGKPFKVADVPEDISSKREKAEVRQEKKKERENQPRTVNKTALAKKIKEQLDGLDLLETMTHDLVKLGMGNTSAKTAKQIEEQGKQLENAQLTGAQAALRAYTTLFTGEDGKFDVDQSSAKREAIYGEALDQLTRLHAIIKQGREYLNKRLADPELAPETQSPIATWLGHKWQLRELKDAGLVQENAELLQLAFHSHDSIARREFVDTGVWMNLNTGKVQVTQTFRPYSAVKYIKSEDSFFKIAQIPELMIYPGEVNPRIRWDGMRSREVTPADYAKARKLAHGDLQALLKEVKNHLKSPLGEKHPIFAIQFEKIGQIEKQFVLVDAKGERIALTDKGLTEEPPTAYLFGLLPASLFEKQTLVGRFHHDMATRKLRIKPLSFITSSIIVRLTF